MDQRDPLLRKKKLHLELTLAIANMKAGEIIQGSRALAALLDNQCSIPTTHTRQFTATCNWLLGSYASDFCGHTCVNRHSHNI